MVKLYIRCNWLFISIRLGGGEREFALNTTKKFQFHKRRRISLVSERLLASQDGLCSLEIIMVLVTEIELTVRCLSSLWNKTCSCDSVILLHSWVTVDTTRHQDIPRFCSLPQCNLIALRRTRWRSWLRHYATNRNVAGSIPNGVTGIFQPLNPSSRIVVQGSSQPLTEMSTRNPCWG